VRLRRRWRWLLLLVGRHFGRKNASACSAAENLLETAIDGYGVLYVLGDGYTICRVIFIRGIETADTVK
jgi:hypothetical protein